MGIADIRIVKFLSLQVVTSSCYSTCHDYSVGIINLSLFYSFI